jgi:hypothetical protein
LDENFSSLDPNIVAPPSFCTSPIAVQAVIPIYARHKHYPETVTNMLEQWIAYDTSFSCFLFHRGEIPKSLFVAPDSPRRTSSGCLLLRRNGKVSRCFFLLGRLELARCGEFRVATYSNSVCKMVRPPIKRTFLDSRDSCYLESTRERGRSICRSS